MTKFTWLGKLSRGRWLLLLVAAAFVVRLAWGIAFDSHESRYDEFCYIGQAVRLAEGQGYVNDNGAPTAYWPPGYPAVLAAAYLLAGQGSWTNIMLQGILGIATCILLWLVGEALFGKTVGRLAALILALYPNHIAYTSLHLTEPLFALLLLGAVALLLDGRPATAAASGLVLGLAVLTRPAIVLVPAVLPFFYWLRGWRPAAAIKRTVLVGCCALVVIGPWMVRNHGVTGRWGVLSTTGGENFWVGNHPAAFGGVSRPAGLVDALWDGETYNFPRGYRLGLDAIRADPLRAALRVVPKLSYFFALETDGVLWNLKGLYDSPPPAMTLSLLGVANLAYVALLAFAVLSLINTPVKHPLALIFYLITGCLLVTVAVFFGDPRYHHALVPFAAIFCAKGVVDDGPLLVRAFKEKRPGVRRRVLTWAMVLAVFGFLVAGNLVLKILELKTYGPETPPHEPAVYWENAGIRSPGDAIRLTVTRRSG